MNSRKFYFSFPQLNLMMFSSSFVFILIDYMYFNEQNLKNKYTTFPATYNQQSTYFVLLKSKLCKHVFKFLRNL